MTRLLTFTDGYRMGLERAIYGIEQTKQALVHAGFDDPIEVGVLTGVIDGLNRLVREV